MILVEPSSLRLDDYLCNNDTFDVFTSLNIYRSLDG